MVYAYIAASIHRALFIILNPIQCCPTQNAVDGTPLLAPRTQTALLGFFPERIQDIVQRDSCSCSDLAGAFCIVT